MSNKDDVKNTAKDIGKTVHEAKKGLNKADKAVEQAAAGVGKEAGKGVGKIFGKKAGEVVGNAVSRAAEKVAGNQVDKLKKGLISKMEGWLQDLSGLGGKAVKGIQEAIGFVGKALGILKKEKNPKNISKELGELGKEAGKSKEGNQFTKTFGKLLTTASKVFGLAAKGKKAGKHVEEAVEKDAKNVDASLGKGPKGQTR
jgi:hypothetical protein